MTSGIKLCLAVGVSTAWLLAAPARAADASVAAKETPPSPATAAAPAQRVSPYANYARAHAEAQKGPSSPARVSLQSMQRSHRATGRPAH